MVLQPRRYGEARTIRGRRASRAGRGVDFAPFTSARGRQRSQRACGACVKMLLIFAEMSIHLRDEQIIFVSSSAPQVRTCPADLMPHTMCRPTLSYLPLARGCLGLRACKLQRSCERLVKSRLSGGSPASDLAPWNPPLRSVRP